MTLREHYEREEINEDGELDISYMEWLEKKLTWIPIDKTPTNFEKKGYFGIRLRSGRVGITVMGWWDFYENWFDWVGCTNANYKPIQYIPLPPLPEDE